MTNNIALKLNNISFAFSKSQPPFFDNLSIDFPANKIHFICGRNGVGKSVLLRLIQGSVNAGEQLTGSVEFNGDHIELVHASLPQRYTNQVRMVHQKFDYMLADMFSFEENLRFANFKQLPGLMPLPAFEPLPAFVKTLGIDMHKPAKLLSGGQRQILATLMMLQKPTKILLLDEPTAALDDENAAMVMRFIQELVGETGLTVLIITHDKELVSQYADGQYYSLFVDQNIGKRILATSSVK